MDEHNRNLRNQIDDLQQVTDIPEGSLIPIGGGYSVDENGEMFYSESERSREVKRRHAYKQRDQRHFTFTRMAEILEITYGLSNKNCGYLLMLQPYVQYKTNIIAMNGREPKPMSKKQIAEVFGVQTRTAKSALDKLVDFGALEINEDGDYKMNERFHFRSKVKGDADQLVKTFHTTLKQLKLKPAELGAVYKLLPYVHYETNLVCKNPFEDNPNKVEFYNKKDISKLFGISPRKASDLFAKLTRAGVIVEIKRKAPMMSEASGDGRETVIAINPSIVTRLRGEHDHKTLLQLFNTSEF
ncbi:hypothetical protein ACFQMN_13810 [Halobacillus campisalis]|uniref:Uncharacterized protein n=2 Tax=Halobacillus campisalis TaxID=435909 RepID=A0ABW2K539_9BACI|nr:hypothetical protein [Halobacillus campisalis]